MNENDIYKILNSNKVDPIDSIKINYDKLLLLHNNNTNVIEKINKAYNKILEHKKRINN